MDFYFISACHSFVYLRNITVQFPIMPRACEILNETMKMFVWFLCWCKSPADVFTAAMFCFNYTTFINHPSYSKYFYLMMLIKSEVVIYLRSLSLSIIAGQLFSKCRINDKH